MVVHSVKNILVRLWMGRQQDADKDTMRRVEWASRLLIARGIGMCNDPFRACFYKAVAIADKPVVLAVYEDVKLQTAIAQHKSRLAVKFGQKISAGLKRWVIQTLGPDDFEGHTEVEIGGKPVEFELLASKSQVLLTSTKHNGLLSTSASLWSRKRDIKAFTHPATLAAIKALVLARLELEQI